MRQVERELSAAVQSHKCWCGGNTTVIVDNNVLQVYLHGHLIYKEKEGRKAFTLAGYDTDVTRNRLRAIGVQIERKNNTTYFKGVEVDKKQWYNI